MTMNKLKGNQRRGFTLVELVISVCVMAIISVYMLQFFIGAKDLNRKAEDLDASVYLSTAVIESIKANVWETSPELQAFGLPLAGSDPEGLEWTAYYDAAWSPLKQKTEQALFQGRLLMKRLSQEGQPKGLYQVTVEMTRLEPYFRGKTPEPVLYTLESKLYIHVLKEVTPK